MISTGNCFICAQVSAAPPAPESHKKFVPAIVVDRIDIGSMVKYMLRFDDGVVSAPLLCTPATRLLASS